MGWPIERFLVVQRKSALDALEHRIVTLIVSEGVKFEEVYQYVKESEAECARSGCSPESIHDSFDNGIKAAYRKNHER